MLNSTTSPADQSAQLLTRGPGWPGRCHPPAAEISMVWRWSYGWYNMSISIQFHHLSMPAETKVLSSQRSDPSCRNPWRHLSQTTSLCFTEQPSSWGLKAVRPWLHRELLMSKTSPASRICDQHVVSSLLRQICSNMLITWSDLLCQHILPLYDFWWFLYFLIDSWYPMLLLWPASPHHLRVPSPTSKLRDRQPGTASMLSSCYPKLIQTS